MAIELVLKFVKQSVFKTQGHADLNGSSRDSLELMATWWWHWGKTWDVLNAELFEWVELYSDVLEMAGQSVN